MDSLLIKNFVDDVFKKASEDIDSDQAVKDFSQKIQTDFDDTRFEDLLMISGFIPDLYANDSSEETLYTKLIEVLVSEWAIRMGCTGECIKTKSDYEDVKITISDKIIVCDAKSFRLSRSQKAPNPKDMVKPDAFREWAARYENSCGGLVTYPSTHDWKKGSVVYRDCSNKDNPILILSYRHLAFLLHYKNSFSPDALLTLWDYATLFPAPLANQGAGNKAPYWTKIKEAMLSITNVDSGDFDSYFEKADANIQTCIADYRKIITDLRKKRKEEIRNAVNSETDIAILKKQLTELRIKVETHDLDTAVNRIDRFRKTEQKQEAKKKAKKKKKA